MCKINKYLSSSVGKKQVVALTGLVWCGFVLTHMAGNCLLFLGSDIYNQYSHALISNPAIYLAEAFLVVTLLIHLGLAIRMTLDSRTARGMPPHRQPSNHLKGASFASRSMILTGLLVFSFIIWHLITFKFGPEYTATVKGVEVRDLYRVVVETFTNPFYVLPYIGILIVLAIHLSHGVTALFQTLGISSVRHAAFKKIGCAFATIIFLGFASQPLYFFIRGAN